MISPTHKRSIERLVKKIDDSIFDENDIKLLLIDIRDLIGPTSFIRELAHFIAHPQRNQGLCYQDLNLRALILKRVIKSPLIPPPLTIPQDILVIKKDLFETVFGLGVTRWKETLTDEQKKLGFDEKQIKAFVSKAYTFNKKDKTYVLNNINDIQRITIIIHNCTARLVNPPLITATALVKQLNEAVSSVFERHIPEKEYKDSILAHAHDIVVCLFCLFQDSQFLVFDGSKGRLNFGYDDSQWSDALNPESLTEASVHEGIELIAKRLQHARLSLMLQCEVDAVDTTTGENIALPVLTSLISSDILLGAYFDDATLREHAAYTFAWNRSTTNGRGWFKSLLDDVRVSRNTSGKLILLRPE